MKIAVVGAGGIGSHLIHMLANTVTKEDEITVFDGDDFEERNLNRQLFGRDMMAENKAWAMMKMYEHICNINANGNFIIEPMDLEEFDMVFCVPDNNLARRIAVDGANEFGYSLIIAGNEATSANAIFYNNDLGLSLDPTKVHPEYLRDSPAANSCSATINENPQTIVANNIAACMCMGLFICWRDNFESEELHGALPYEYIWGKTFFKKATVNEILTCQINKEQS